MKEQTSNNQLVTLNTGLGFYDKTAVQNTVTQKKY
jgi:hypothetical protein